MLYMSCAPKLLVYHLFKIARVQQRIRGIRFVAPRPVGLSVLMLSACMFFSASVITGCDSGSAIVLNSPAPWPTQLAVAQQAALKINKEAVLWYILAAPLVSPSKDWNDSNSAYRLFFIFDAPPKSSITVQLEDTAPSATVKATQGTIPGYERLVTPDSLREKAMLLEKVKISPREAGQKTWRDASVHFASAAELPPMISLAVGLNFHHGSASSEWMVVYSRTNENPSETGGSITYMVDAENGKIVSTDYNTTTPTVQLSRR